MLVTDTMVVINAVWAWRPIGLRVRVDLGLSCPGWRNGCGGGERRKGILVRWMTWMTRRFVSAS
jgi:hypothetical protein